MLFVRSKHTSMKIVIDIWQRETVPQEADMARGVQKTNLDGLKVMN